MIENISINNYALIDHTHIELEKGFSVITGETGAGKSILLGAIGLTLGQRADSSAIMDKTKKCIVEIEYNIAGYALKEWFDENDLDYSEQVMVRRELTAEGKHIFQCQHYPGNFSSGSDPGNFSRLLVLIGREQKLYFIPACPGKLIYRRDPDLKLGMFDSQSDQ